jgi:hypothetical protein
VSCPDRFAAAASADRKPDAQIVHCSAHIRFTFIVFITPRLMVFTEPSVLYAHLYNAQHTQFVSPNRRKQGTAKQQFADRANLAV